MFELKPCPICEAEAIIINRDGVGSIKCSNRCRCYKASHYTNMFGEDDWYPFLMFQFGDHVQTKKKEAMKQWNAFELPQSFEQEREKFELEKDRYIFDKTGK